MLKLFKLILILITLLYLPQQSSAQTINIIPTQTLQDAQVMYFSNFDIFDVGSPFYLFDVEIGGITHTYPYAEIVLEFKLNQVTIASATSDPFTIPVPPSGNSWKASNIELLKTHTFPGSGMIIEFNTTSFDPPDDNFEDEVYGSGRARSSIYELYVRLLINSTQEDEEIVTLKITNPSNIQLSGPGNKVGSGIPHEIMTELPVFTFFSDGTEFILHIFEKLSHHNSIEDVINSGNPICSEPLTTPVFNYAVTTTGQPLQAGHTYYWYVDVLVPTTAGIEKFRSEVFQFKLIQASGAPPEGTAVTSVIEMLRPVVGNQVDNISKNLADFELKNIRLNGKPITIYELHQIIDGYEGHLIEVLDLVLY